MADRVLIDTSSWIEWTRASGNPDVSMRVQDLIDKRLALTCAFVRLELWNGARGDKEKKKLRELEDWAPDLDIDPAVWENACDLALQARSSGLTIPASDLLIFSCARYHGVDFEACDKHFELLAKL